MSFAIALPRSPILRTSSKAYCGSAPVPTVARRYVERLPDRCHRITIAPQGGRPRDDPRPGAALGAVRASRRDHYRVLGKTVEILNVFHGRRDYAALYRRYETDHE